MAPHTAEARFQAPCDLAWQTWDTESVAYNPRSGDTHLLDLVAAEGLRCLQQAALTPQELQQQLAQRLGIEADAQLLRYVQQLLDHLEELGLAKRSATSANHERPA